MRTSGDCDGRDESAKQLVSQRGTGGDNGDDVPDSSLQRSSLSPYHRFLMSGAPGSPSSNLSSFSPSSSSWSLSPWEKSWMLRVRRQR